MPQVRSWSCRCLPWRRQGCLDLEPEAQVAITIRISGDMTRIIQSIITRCYNGGIAVEHTTAGVADDVTAHQFGIHLVVDLVHKFSDERCVTDQVVHLSYAADRLLQRQVHYG